MVENDRGDVGYRWPILVLVSVSASTDDVGDKKRRETTKTSTDDLLHDP